MANMKDMRDLVTLIKQLNDDHVEEHHKNVAHSKRDKVGHILTDHEYKRALIRKQGAIDEFIKSFKVDEQKARDIYGDATSNRYAYLRDVTDSENYQKVDVTSDGRGLIKKRFWGNIPTGLWRESIEKLWPITGAVTTIILCIAAVINVVIAYYIYRHK